MPPRGGGGGEGGGGGFGGLGETAGGGSNQNLMGVDLPRPQVAEENESLPFLGWDYEAIGWSLAPGEDIVLRFRNATQSPMESPIFWSIEDYTTNEILAKGEGSVDVGPGAVGEVPVDLPEGLEDGPYRIRYSYSAADLPIGRPYYFDYRKAQPQPQLNLNIVALVENMDPAGWVRMMLNPVSQYVNIVENWPGEALDIDAAIVLGETYAANDPEIEQLMQFVREGGTVLVMGKPPASLSEMLPVSVARNPIQKASPVRLQVESSGPWQGFEADSGPAHYPVQVEAKDGATVLAQWDGGMPAVVQGEFGQGKVIYAGSGPWQVWQDDPAFHGADELAIRLLYWGAKGEEALQAALDHVQEAYGQQQAENEALRDWVFENQTMPAPEEFYVVSNNNIGRFGWLAENGGLVENITADQRVMYEANAGDAFTLAVNGESGKSPGEVKMGWLAETMDWEYPNGETVRTTMSLGSPGLLWEGDAQQASLEGWKSTHAAYMSEDGMAVAAAGETIDGARMTENWLLTFVADEQTRDVPHLIVLTRRPESIAVAADEIAMSFGSEGFGAFFTCSPWGIRRLAPGETKAWIEDVPSNIVSSAQGWSKAFLNFPTEVVTIGWAEQGDVVHQAERFRYRTFETDWNTEAIQLAPVPPVVFMAKAVEAPIEVSGQLIDLACATKFGYLRAAPGDSTHMTFVLPPMDHRALMQVEGRMDLQAGIDLRPFGSHPMGNPDRGPGDLYEDLNRYGQAENVPYNVRYNIDPYRWWVAFNSLLGKPFYSENVRNELAGRFQTRFWEGLNFYAHKMIVTLKREPYSQVEYLIHFIWPNQTDKGYHNFNDANEASGVNAYAFANYARYYGDFATLRANWNILRAQYAFLPRTDDWAAMCSAAFEFWRVAGYDMLNSEYVGSMAFAYAAKNTGNEQDRVQALVSAARALTAATGRYNWKGYIQEITADGDPWRIWNDFLYFNEYGIQVNASGGGIGMLDTSKGMAHELPLAYKVWAPQAAKAREASRGGRGGISNETIQKLFLGWDWETLWEQAKAAGSDPGNRRGWLAGPPIYNMALIGIGDIPLFLSDWAPAEYKVGYYDPDTRHLRLEFVNHEGGEFPVKIYSQRQPETVSANGEELGADAWQYDASTGWLIVSLSGSEPVTLEVALGEPVAPLHPYFTKVE